MNIIKVKLVQCLLDVVTRQFVAPDSSCVELMSRDEDPDLDPVGSVDFGPLDPDPLLFSLNPDPDPI